jgi:hypothetical protein
MIRKMFFIFPIFILTAIGSAAEQTAAIPKYNETEMEKRCDEFVQSLDLLKIVHDYPQVVQNLLAVNPQRQIIGLKTLSETSDLNAIPWIIIFLDSDGKDVKICAGSVLQKLVSSYTLQRRDMKYPDRIVIKPLNKNDVDLRPLAWIILKMLRNSEDGNLQSCAAVMAGYLNLDYFDDELHLLEKSKHPAVVNSAQWALGMLTNSKEKPQEQASKDEDYKVYSDVLVQLNPERTDKDVFVIRQMTKIGKGSGQVDKNTTKNYLKRKFGTEISEELIGNFFEVNSKENILHYKFSKELHVILISEIEEKEIFQPADGNGWERFYSNYAGAKSIIELSRIAFNAEKTEALLYYGSNSGDRAGIGYYILLKKQDNEWVIQNMVMCWIS